MEIEGLRHGGMRSGIFLLDGCLIGLSLLSSVYAKATEMVAKGFWVKLVFDKVKWKCPSLRLKARRQTSELHAPGGRCFAKINHASCRSEYRSLFQE